MMQDPRVLRKSSSSLASPFAPICRHVLWLELWTAAVVDYFFFFQKEQKALDQPF